MSALFSFPRLGGLIFLAAMAWPVTAQEIEQGDERPTISPPPLTEASLIEASETARAFTPRDDFETQPKTSWKGRRFVVHQALERQTGDSCAGLPKWDFNSESGSLSFNVTGGFILGHACLSYDGDPFPVLRMYGQRTLAISCSQKEGNAYGVVNAFGARSSIVRRSITATALAIEGWDTGRAFLLKSIPLEGSEAREIVAHLSLEIEGELTEWTDGRSLICGVTHLDPEFTSAYDTTESTCLYKARLSRVAVLDGTSGNVLAEERFPELP